MKPTRKMILAQNLLFNCPFVLVMVAVTNIINGQSFGPETTGMIIIGFVVMELLGLVIPVKKISGVLGRKLFHGQNPMAFPQLFLTAVVMTMIFTSLMTLIMTFIGMKLDGAPMTLFWAGVTRSFPWLCLASYCSVLVFLPLSMTLSGMDKLAGGNLQK